MLDKLLFGLQDNIYCSGPWWLSNTSCLRTKPLFSLQDNIYCSGPWCLSNTSCLRTKPLFSLQDNIFCSGPWWLSNTSCLRRLKRPITRWVTLRMPRERKASEREKDSLLLHTIGFFNCLTLKITAFKVSVFLP